VPKRPMPSSASALTAAPRTLEQRIPTLNVVLLNHGWFLGLLFGFVEPQVRARQRYLPPHCALKRFERDRHYCCEETTLSATAMTIPQTLTWPLPDWSGGKRGNLDDLAPLVYDELRRLTHSYMRRERPGHTLATTGLVHEAYLRLADQEVIWQNRDHFFGIAAKMMRHVLVDHAKSQQREKRGGGAKRLSLEESELVSEGPDMDLVALDEALARLDKLDPQRARIVELRFFGGLSNEEASEVLAISPATVQRQWAGARAWLFHELNREN
jgi:RNA polymerase sigma factor (TIGR02999 family)